MTENNTPLASVGIEGLDTVLGGGLTHHRLYLVEGTPGSGKTTLALQFLRAGAALGERVLYVSGVPVYEGQSGPLFRGAPS